MFIVQATAVYKTEDGWTGTIQIPTFYLHEDMQGIVNEEHAKEIAKRIIDPWKKFEAVHMCVIQMENYY